MASIQSTFGQYSDFKSDDRFSVGEQQTSSFVRPLPTPPAEHIQPLGSYTQPTATVAAAVACPPSMLPGADPMGAPASFTARRPNASNLPTFELPPPPSMAYPHHGGHKYGYQSVSNQPSTSSLTSVGNLLTPPSNSSADGLSPVSSNANSGSLSYPSSNTGMWQPAHSSATASYGYQASAGQQQYGAGRAIFSPSLNSIVRANSSPTTGELPPPPPTNYDMHQYSSPMSATNMSAPQNQMMPMMNGTAPAPVSQASPVNTQEAFSRPPPTPNYFSSTASTPQQSSYAYSTGPSPIQQSPLSAGSMNKMSPVSGHGGMFPPLNPQSQYAQQHRPYSYPGPVLSNINNPQGGMAIMGPHGMFPGYNSGHAAQMPHMYGHPAQHNPQNDRPFRCDQCPQSFNRNHDLKRHKRIHLAVKPFPCGHCDKSFSRKDALKVSSLRT